MARTEKKTRLRYLPPYAQRAIKDGSYGSYPGKFRTAADGQSGITASFWDDDKAISYGVTQNLLPFSLIQSGAAINTANDLDSQVGAISAKMKRGMGDYFAPNYNSVVLQRKPYRDINDFAGDGAEDAFYQTGSTIQVAGGGFQQPLTAKTVLTFDIEIAAEFCEWGIRSGSDSDYTMVYYNRNTKFYDPIGASQSFTSYPRSFNKAYFEEKAVGFGPCSDYVYMNEHYMGGSPISAFGFPNHPKYMPTTENYFHSLENMLTGPFLLEKVVVEFSASITNIQYAPDYQSDVDIFGNPYFAPQESSARMPSSGPSYGTFFILNARRGARVDNSLNKVGADNFIGPKAVSLFTGASLFANVDIGKAHTSGSIELVTYLQFGYDRALNDSETIRAAQKRELMFNSGSDITNGFTTGFSVMSGTVKSPTKVTDWSSYILPSGWMTAYYYTAFRNGNRNDLPMAVGRNWQSIVGAESKITNTDTVTSTIFPKVSAKPSVDNGYILHPKDKLIFGWQSPYPQRFDVDPWYKKQGPTMTMPRGQYVLKLYGSYVEDDGAGGFKEKHDTLSDFLTSEDVHEVIG